MSLNRPGRFRPRSSSSLRAAGPDFQRLYERFDRSESGADPVHLVRRYDSGPDREVAGFCASALAFGRVASVLTSIESVLTVLGPSPVAFVRGFDPVRDRVRFRAFKHRWTRGEDIVALLWILKQMITRAGSIEDFFLRGYQDSAEDVGDALNLFSKRALALAAPVHSGGTRYFFPRASGGSACKRLNLFLRWMVRRDKIDFGVWQQVSAAKLVVPLDTHVARVSQCLGLTRYQSPGWPMAREITSSLRQIAPEDPVKYDFSLCHIGMQGYCGFNRKQGNAGCPLRAVCRPSRSRSGASRRSSAQR